MLYYFVIHFSQKMMKHDDDRASLLASIPDMSFRTFIEEEADIFEITEEVPQASNNSKTEGMHDCRRAKKNERKFLST